MVAFIRVFLDSLVGRGCARIVDQVVYVSAPQPQSSRMASQPIPLLVTDVQARGRTREPGTMYMGNELGQ